MITPAGRLFGQPKEKAGQNTGRYPDRPSEAKGVRCGSLCIVRVAQMQTGVNVTSLMAEIPGLDVRATIALWFRRASYRRNHDKSRVRPGD